MKRRLTAGLTVEAAVIVPLLLFLFGMAMRCGIQLYTECRDTAVVVQNEQKLEIVQEFYFWQGIEEIGRDED